MKRSPDRGRVGQEILEEGQSVETETLGSLLNLFQSLCGSLANGGTPVTFLAFPQSRHGFLRSGTKAGELGDGRQADVDRLVLEALRQGGNRFGAALPQAPEN